ncbi:MAG: lysophospholipid acyltransferase family protein [Myxococcota bacterium]
MALFTAEVSTDQTTRAIERGMVDLHRASRLPSTVSTAIKRSARPETFAEAKARLSWLERANIAFIRRTFEWSWMDRFCRWGCRVPGAGWVYACTRHLLQIHGLERLPPLSQLERVILVSNHRSFFDMYVINAVLYKNGFRQRLLFPVRSGFFYDRFAGFFVNAIMSFWSMYPPIFRDRQRLSLNHTAFSELARAVMTGRSAGIHPEGTRNMNDNPYTLLPAQNGVGRLIHLARGATVVPVFINGLINDLPRQIRGNFDGTGRRIHVVFGAPINYDEMLTGPASTRTYRSIVQRTMQAITTLGEEEKRLRASMDRDQKS